MAPLLCRATRSPSRFASASFRQFRIPRERTGGQTVRTGAAPRFSSRARHEERLSRGEDQKIRVEVNLHLVGCEPPAINLLPPFSILSIFFATWRFRTLSLALSLFPRNISSRILREDSAHSVSIRSSPRRSKVIAYPSSAALFALG